MSDAQPVNLRKLRMLLGKRNAVIIVALVITSLVVTGFVWAHKKVTITADGNTITVSTIHSSPEEVLAQAAVNLGPKDEFRLSTAKLMNGTTIEVYRAVPVALIYQNKTETIITGKPTVGELTASLGFTKQNSYVVPSEDTRITAGMEIKIAAVTEKLVTERQPVSPPVVRQPDGNLERDVEEIIQPGTEGIKEASIKLRFVDGQQVAAEVVGEKIITQPNPQIVHVGTRDTVQTSRGSMRFSRTYIMEATAYNPTDGAPHGLTAMGIAARRGIVAVDPDIIPMGSRVYIPGYGLALAADVGGAIVGNRIDLCVEDYDEAVSFGRRMVKVYVLAD
jgi:uncharacterized protein YabE (DUF348 family)